MSLAAWSYLFLVVYIGAMLAIGVVGQRRVRHADDFATARGGYGPLYLAFAFAATTASGATFLGGPGLAYSYGLATVWGNFLYPIGVYFGVLISMRLIAASGNRFGNRTIPEYLGDRFQSNGIRVLVSLFSLVLFFYLVGQLVSGLVMFEIMLGMPPLWALIVTSSVLLIYVVLGGAHADILTDGAQGVMMLVLAIVVIAAVRAWRRRGRRHDGLARQPWAARCESGRRAEPQQRRSTTRRGPSSASCSRTCPLACCRISATSCGRSKAPTNSARSSNSRSRSASRSACWDWPACSPAACSAAPCWRQARIPIKRCRCCSSNCFPLGWRR